MAVIFDSLKNSYCKIDLGMYAALRWNVFLMAEDDKFILFSKNSKLGLVNKKELKSLTLVRSATDNEISEINNHCHVEQKVCLIQNFIDKCCKIQMVGTFLDMDGVIKRTIISADSDSVQIQNKHEKTIMNTERIVYIVET